LQYYTRFYRLHDDAEFPATPAPIIARLRYLNALAFPCDNRTFSLTLACFVDDPFRRALAHPDVFERVLLSLPVTALWVQSGEPISPVHAMARIENRWQRGRICAQRHCPILERGRAAVTGARVGRPYRGTDGAPTYTKRRVPSADGFLAFKQTEPAKPRRSGTSELAR
jgi:hypothetical protein